MKAAAESYSYINKLSVPVAGKTGTAQENTRRADHALFVGYAPYNNPEIAVSCRICFGYSSGFASQTSAKVFEYYFAEDKAEVMDDKAVEINESLISNAH
jgi:penicillin-binding protein 2